MSEPLQHTFTARSDTGEEITIVAVWRHLETVSRGFGEVRRIPGAMHTLDGRSVHFKGPKTYQIEGGGTLYKTDDEVAP